VIWGLAFVAQSVSSGQIRPWTFNTIRFAMGFLVLLPISRHHLKQKRTWIGGVLCGTVLCLASFLQQKGIETTVTGKAGFITSLYLVIVPFLSVATGKKVTVKNWVCVALAMGGMYLLTGMQRGGLSHGELLILASAFCYALHIMVIDHFKDVDGIALSTVQFLTATVIGIPLTILEAPAWEAVKSVAVPLVYAGVMSCGVAYTLQILGQKYVEPAKAVLPLSLESVFSAVFGFLILGQKLSPRELVGCAVVFGAVVLSQKEPAPQRNT
jgi:drug/metabolite transporter (DMT)-like permease